MLYRIIYTGKGKGPIQIRDTTQGPPLDSRRVFEGVPMYLTPTHKRIVESPLGGLYVKEDKELPGYIDLVPTDNVKTSLKKGNLKELVERGYVECLEIPTGALGKPEIVGFVYTKGRLVLQGFFFESYYPHETVISGKVEYRDGRYDSFEFEDLRKPIIDPANPEDLVTAEVEILKGVEIGEEKRGDVIIITEIPSLENLNITLKVTANGKPSEGKKLEIITEGEEEGEVGGITSFWGSWGPWGNL